MVVAVSFWSTELGYAQFSIVVFKRDNTPRAAHGMWTEAYLSNVPVLFHHEIRFHEVLHPRNSNKCFLLRKYKILNEVEMIPLIILYKQLYIMYVK